MPVHRDKDGNIVEEPTRFEPSGEAPTAPGEQPGRRGSSAGETTVVKPPGHHGASGDDTVVIGKSAPGIGDSGGGGGDGGGMTRLVGAPGKSRQETPATTPLGGPVVGWLVVIKGRGCGHSAPLGYGRNSIGRASSERVSLDFGDENISRTHHAAVTYDPRGRKFYISHGDSNNLTYLGDRPVLNAEVLEPLADIGIGETVLRFVPFCGEDFDWQESGQESK